MARSSSNAAAAAVPQAPAPEQRAAATSVAVPKLDRVIHERIRLGIVSALAANEALAFNDLKRLLNTTDGNLSVHARKLEEAGYVLCSKTFEGRMPKTEYRLSDKGKEAFSKYLSHMEALIQSARGGGGTK